MAILTKPSFAPSTSLVYITVGALMGVWTTVYYYMFQNDGDPATRQTVGFWLLGFFLTGMVLMVIGLALGPIGRAARQAEMPPAEVTPQAAQAEMTAAQAPIVVPAAAPVAQVAPAPAPAATTASTLSTPRPVGPLSGNAHAQS